MKRPVPLHLQAHSLRAQPADGDDLDADDFDDAASNCSWSAWDDPPLLPKAAPPLHSSRPRWPFRRRLYAAPAAADPADDLPSPEDEPSFTDTLMELCGTLDEFPGDDPALGESLLDDEITQAFPRVAAVRPPASPDTGLQPPPDLGNLALSDPQIPSDVIIVDVAVDNHTQGIVIEDGPCAGVSLATILPFVPPRPAIPRKVRTDEPVAAASEKLPPRSTVSAPAAAPAQAQRAPVERRHTLPAGMHIDLSQHHAPIPRGPASAVAPRTLPPREVAPPLRRVLRSPHAPIAAAAQELATPSQPRHPVINTQRRRDTDAPASAVSAPTPTAGPASAPPAAAPVPLGPRRATEPSIPVTASAPPRPAPPPAVVPPPTLKTEAVLPVQPMVGSPMVASPMITSPVLVSPQEPPAAVAPAPAAAPAPAVAGEAPRPAPRRPGRPPKSQQYKPPPAASRYSTRSSGPTPNPLPTPDATRPTTPLAPVPLDPNAPRQYDEGQQLVAPFVKRGPGRPKKQASVVIPPAAPDAAAQAQQAMHVQPVEAKLEVPAPLPVPTEPIVVMSASVVADPSPEAMLSDEHKKPNRPRRRADTLDEIREREAEADAAVAANPSDARAIRRAERAKAAQHPAVVVHKRRSKGPRPSDAGPGAENAAPPRNEALPPVPAPAPLAEEADKEAQGRKRAASPAREPSPKRIKSPELPKIHSPAPAGASSPAPEHEEVHETVEIAQEQQQDDGLAAMEIDAGPGSPSAEEEARFVDVPEEQPQEADTPAAQGDASKVVVFRKETDATLVESEFQGDVAMEQYRTPESLTDVTEDARSERGHADPAPAPRAHEQANDDGCSLPDSDKTAAGKGGMSPGLSDWVQVTPILSEGRDDNSEAGSPSAEELQGKEAAVPVVAARPVIRALPLVDYASDSDGADSDAELLREEIEPVVEDGRREVGNKELERMLFDDALFAAASGRAAARADNGSGTEEEPDSDSELDPAVISISGKPTAVGPLKATASITYEDEDELVAESYRPRPALASDNSLEEEIEDEVL